MIYGLGEASYKCVHDSEKLYFALEIPGEYRFNATNDEQCAAIGTMMKMGSNVRKILSRSVKVCIVDG
jgi:hypothetical protein